MLTVTGITIGIPVTDLRAAQRWYEAVLDVHEQRARLVGLGAEGGDVEVVDGVIAWWDFSDPDGNGLSLYTLLAEDGPPLAAAGVEVSR